MSVRSRFFIRTVGTLTGDFAVGFTMAAACVWVIEGAALGVFLSFLLWIMAALVSLALSQYVVHPLAATLLSDRKLDQGLAAASAALRSTQSAARRLWGSHAPMAARTR